MNIIANEKKITSRNLLLTEDNWPPQYDRILELFMEGKDFGLIAKETKINSKAIKGIMASPVFLNKVRTVRTKIVDKIIERRSMTGEYDATSAARKLLTESSVKAAEIVIKLAQSGENVDRVKLEACKDILDRCGLKAIEIVETRERVYQPAEVERARKILDESQDIVARLATQSSPYVLGDSRSTVPESSDTDKAHADAALEVSTD